MEKNGESPERKRRAEQIQLLTDSFALNIIANHAEPHTSIIACCITLAQVVAAAIKPEHYDEAEKMIVNRLHREIANAVKELEELRDSEIEKYLKGMVERIVGEIQPKSCVICGKPLPAPRPHVDTCSEPCYKKLLAQQRGA